MRQMFVASLSASYVKRRAFTFSSVFEACASAYHQFALCPDTGAMAGKRLAGTGRTGGSTPRPFCCVFCASYFTSPSSRHKTESARQRARAESEKVGAGGCSCSEIEALPSPAISAQLSPPRHCVSSSTAHILSSYVLRRQAVRGLMVMSAREFAGVHMPPRRASCRRQR